MTTIDRGQFNFLKDKYGKSDSDMLSLLKKQGFEVTIEREIQRQDAQKKVQVQQKKVEVAKKEPGRTWGSKLKSVAQNMVGGALESAKGVPKLALTAINAPKQIEDMYLKWGASEEFAKMASNKFREQVMGETFGDEGSVAFQGTKLVGDLGQLGAGSAIGKAALKGTQVAKGATALKSSGTAGKVALGAVEGAVDVAAFEAISKQETVTPTEAAIGGVIGGAIPLVGAAVKGVAPKLQLSGLLNPKKFDDIKNSIILEGVDNAQKASPEDVANWMFARNIKGNKTQIVQQLGDIVEKSKQAKQQLLAKSATTHAPKAAKETLELVVEEINNLPGHEDLLQKAASLDTGRWTLSQLDEIKSLGDEVFSIFKSGPSGSVKDSLKKEGLAKIRRALKSFIESQAMKEGLAEGVEQNAVKLLNNQTAIAFNLKQAIARKESSDSIREIIQFLGGRSPGAIVGAGVGATVGPFDGNTTEGKIGNILFGAVAGGAIASTSLKTKVANSLDNMGAKHKSEIYEWMLKRGDGELSEGAVANLEKVTDLFNDQ